MLWLEFNSYKRRTWPCVSRDWYVPYSDQECKSIGKAALGQNQHGNTLKEDKCLSTLLGLLYTEGTYAASQMNLFEFSYSMNSQSSPIPHGPSGLPLSRLKFHIHVMLARFSRYEEHCTAFPYSHSCTTKPRDSVQKAETKVVDND